MKRNCFFFTSKNNLNITNYNAVFDYVKNNNIELIINCAAYTKVVTAENEQNDAFSVNHFAVENLVLCCQKFNCKLIHISTDYVFDGLNNKPYLETDSPNPINNYGISKYNGEQSIIKANLSKSIIIRTSWLYSSFNDNFFYKIIIKARIKSRRSDNYGF